MKIGELAKLTGLATSRIRFYEASGLIRSQRKANGYRDYAADTVWILELVTGAQGAGFSPGGDRSPAAERRRRLAARRAARRLAPQGGRDRGPATTPGTEQGTIAGGHRKHREQAGRSAVHGKHPARAGAPARGRPSTDGRASTANPLAGPLPRRRSSGFPTLDLEVDLNLRVTPTHPDSLPKPAADGITHRGRSTQ